MNVGPLSNALRKPIIHIDDFILWHMGRGNIKKEDEEKVEKIYEDRRRALLQGIEILSDGLKKGVLYWREFVDNGILRIDHVESSIIEEAEEEWKFVKAMEVDPLAIGKEDRETFERLIKQFFLGNLMINIVRKLAGMENELEKAVELVEKYGAFEVASYTEMAQMEEVANKVKDRKLREMLVKLNGEIERGKILMRKAVRKNLILPERVKIKVRKEWMEERETQKNYLQLKMAGWRRRLMKELEKMGSLIEKIKEKILKITKKNIKPIEERIEELKERIFEAERELALINQL